MPKIKLAVTPISTIEIEHFLDITNPEYPITLNSDQLQLLQNEAKEKNTPFPPENVISFKVKWRKISFGLQQVIEQNSYIDRIVQGKREREFDYNAMTLARIRVLLAGWTLDELDESLKLSYEPSIDDNSLKILSAQTMRVISNMPPAIMVPIYTEMVNKVLTSTSGAISDFLKRSVENTQTS